jgi:hypothetical protein
LEKATETGTDKPMKPVKRARVGAYDDLLAEVADAIEKARNVVPDQ